MRHPAERGALPGPVSLWWLIGGPAHFSDAVRAEGRVPAADHQLHPQRPHLPQRGLPLPGAWLCGQRCAPRAWFRQAVCNAARVPDAACRRAVGGQEMASLLMLDVMNLLVRRQTSASACASSASSKHDLSRRADERRGAADSAQEGGAVPAAAHPQGAARGGGHAARGLGRQAGARPGARRDIAGFGAM